MPPPPPRTAGLLPGATSPPSSPYPPPPSPPTPKLPPPTPPLLSFDMLSSLCCHPGENLPLRSRGESVFLYPGPFPSCGRGAEIISDEFVRMMLFIV